jgi:hypothetical protein
MADSSERGSETSGPLKAGDFLTTSKTISFSRNILCSVESLHGIIRRKQNDNFFN